MRKLFHKLLFVAFILMNGQSYAAISASAVWEVRLGGNDTNGGGFVTGSAGTDYSLQNAKNVNGGADGSSVLGVTAGSTTVTCADCQFGTTIVGNIIYLAGGTGTLTGVWKQVTARGSTTSITVDSSTGIGASTGVTINIGGALLSPGIAASLITVSSMIVYIQAGGSSSCTNTAAFCITSATGSVAGGVITNASSVTGIFVGYTSTRTLMNTDAKPTIQINSGLSTTVMTSCVRCAFINLILDGNSQTSSSVSSNGFFLNDTIQNFTAVSTGTLVFLGVLATGNSAAVLGGQVMFCEAYGNTATPINTNYLFYTLSYLNTGASTDGATVTGNQGKAIVGFTSVSNGRAGFLNAGSGFTVCLDCVFQTNGITTASSGFNNNSVSVGMCWSCGFYNNNSAAVSATAPNGYNISAITLSGDAFTNSAGNVFTLNALASQGAALRAIALPALFPRGLTANILSVGAAQVGGTSGQVGYAQ